MSGETQTLEEVIGRMNAHTGSEGVQELGADSIAHQDVASMAAPTCKGPQMEETAPNISVLSTDAWKFILQHLSWQSVAQFYCVSVGLQHLVKDQEVEVLCGVLAEKGAVEVERRLRQNNPSGIPADLGRLDQVRRFVGRYRDAKIKSVYEWMQVASQEPDSGWLFGGSRKSKMQGLNLMEQVVGKPQEYGRVLGTLTGHSDYVRSVAFSPDGKTVVSGSDDKTVKLWDVASGAEKCSLTRHSSFVTSVAFSPDCKTVVTGSVDETVKLWDVASGAEKCSLAGIMASWQGLDAETKALAAKVKDQRAAGGKGEYIVTGGFIVTAGSDMVYVYMTTSDREMQGEPLACFRSPAFVCTVRCKETLVVAGCSNGQVLFLEAPLLDVG